MLQYATRISKEDFLQHQLKLPVPHKPISNKRKPGRPPKLLSINEALQPQADNNTSDEESNKKPCRINWFKSPFIHDIIDAYKTYQSGFLTVKYLRLK
jgi:hypothetical protein